MAAHDLVHANPALSCVSNSARAQQLADLGEVAGDAFSLPGQFAELALGYGLEPLDVVLSVGQELVAFRLGLGDDLADVLLGDGYELLGVLVCLAQGLLCLRVGLGGPLLSRGGPLLRFGDQRLGGRSRCWLYGVRTNFCCI
jgi:hypothetical protein